jgi:hypothetical protein
METIKPLDKVATCAFRGTSREALSRYSANHKRLGWIKICRARWVSLYNDNRMVVGSGGSSGNSCPPCGL